MKTNIIEYIIKNKELKQKDLAETLGVSRAQISKWKSGEHIPHDREKELMEIAGLFGFSPSWAILVKTEENSQAWIDYMEHMNQIVDDTYSSPYFDDEAEIYTSIIIQALCELGLKIPEKAPEIKNDDESEDYEFSDFDDFVYQYLTNYGPITTWCQKYLSEDDKDGYMLYDLQQDLSCHYPIFLTLKYIDNKLLEKNGFDLNDLKSKLSEEENNARKDIHRLCLMLSELKVSFKTDYYDLVNKHPYELDDILTFSGAMRYSPNSSVAMEEYFSFPDRLILAELRATRMLYEEINEKIDKLLPSE